MMRFQSSVRGHGLARGSAAVQVEADNSSPGTVCRCKERWDGRGVARLEASRTGLGDTLDVVWRTREAGQQAQGQC